MCVPMVESIVTKFTKFWRSSTTDQPRQEQHELQERQGWSRWPRRQRRSSSPSTESRKRPRLDRESSLPCIWIKYGQVRLMYRLNQGQQYHTITVGDIKQYCKQSLRIPLCTMVVKYNGGYLKDNHASLESLGILPRTSQIDVFGDRVTDEQKLEMESGDIEEVGACQIIKKLVDENQHLVTRVMELEKHHQVRERQHLSQTLTRVLITLDDVECSSQFKTARQERRQAIRIYKDLLERVEGLELVD